MATGWIIEKTVDLAKPPRNFRLEQPYEIFYGGDNDSATWRVHVERNGEPVTLNGTVVAYVTRPDGMIAYHEEIVQAGNVCEIDDIGNPDFDVPGYVRATMRYTDSVSGETVALDSFSCVVQSDPAGGTLIDKDGIFGRYGVSGVGGSAAKLTRVWDAADFTDPVPSTDTVQGSSPFDNIKPFNRRKCVGTWSKDPNSAKAVFTVNAYFGDGGYAEDGTMGDYVAIDVEPFYYYQHDGVIAVSRYHHPGFAIHPVCVDAEGNVRKHTYIPAYTMAMVDGHPVSLPGYDNFRGGYADHMTNARKYNNADAKAYAIIEPAAVMHYEWLLMTIEYATQNMQAFINGAVSMRYSANDIIVSIPAANQIVVGAGGADLVVGQTIYMGSAYDAAVDVALYNHITAIRTCDENGTANENGDYYLITYDGADRTGTLVAGTSKFCSRPWITGATAGYAHGVHAVIGHTGSPVDLLNGRYPMRYRWRENVYGNQNMTLLDLMSIRVEDDTNVYHLDWYHLSDPSKATTSNPSKATLTNPANGWARLSVFTPSDEYKNGYVKEFTPDTAHPHIRIPTVMTGGSATTYSCDYADLVNSFEVRAVRRGGSVANGATAGPYYLYTISAPSAAHWYSGAALFFIQ